MFDGFIFDVDGTLWDSTPIAAASYNKVFEKEGLSYRVDADLLKQLFGKPMDVIFQHIMPDEDPAYAKQLADECMEVENDDLAKMPGTFYEGVEATLKALSEQVPVFIVSNCQKGYIELVVKWAGLENTVKDFLCFGDTGTSKGQTILKLMEKNGLKNPVYVGDVQGDADACKEAGIPIIYCKYGFGTVKEPYGTIEKPADLLKFI